MCIDLVSIVIEIEMHLISLSVRDLGVYPVPSVSIVLFCIRNCDVSVFFMIALRLTSLNHVIVFTGEGYYSLITKVKHLLPLS